MVVLRARLRDEAGLAVPSVITLIAIGLAFATAASVAAMTTLRGTTRDHNSKAALAAADAGAEVALWRQNQVAIDESLACVVESASASLVAVAPESDGWCRSQPDEPGTVGDAQYTYRTKVAPAVQVNRDGALITVTRRVTVVSTGSADGVTRRVKATAIAPTGEAIFGTAGAIGIDSLSVGTADISANPPTMIIGTDADGNPIEHAGGAASNGEITFGGSGTICGFAQYGYGQGPLEPGHAGPGCTLEEGEGQVNLGVPVAPSSDQNCRITYANAPVPECSNGFADTLSPDEAKTVPGKFSWNESTRTLSLKSNTTLTLGGSEYRLCRLTMEGGSTLVISAESRAQIFIIDPQDPLCDADPAAAGHQPPAQPQFEMLGNTSIVATNDDPTSAAIIMVGSDVPTSAYLGGTAKQNDFMLYAPRTDVTVTGNSTYIGAMAGKTLNLQGSATLQIPASANGFGTNVLTRYERERYVECSVATGSTPDADC